MTDAPTDPDPAPDDHGDDWVPVVSVGSASELREVLALLVAAKIPVRPMAEPALATYAVLVPAAEVEVAAGVIDHFLVERQGDAEHAEIVAELEAHANLAVDDATLAARHAAAEAQARRRARRVAILLALAFVGYAVALSL